MSDNSSFSDFDCFTSHIGISMIISFVLTKMMVILFLSISVFYVGYQQWHHHCSLATSHSDIFTYNVIAIQLIFVLGTILTLCGIYTNHSVVFGIGLYGVAFAYPGEIFFNTLTCVERYLAVVHPVTYLGLRQSGGIRIRNICIGCGWMLCFGWLAIAVLYGSAVFFIPYLCLTVPSLIIVSFCSLSDLCILNRPGPGDMGADRHKIDHSKHKAFCTITAIMVILLLYFLGIIITAGLNNSYLLHNKEKCLVLLSGNWFNLPISLILPLLFLQRRGKLSCSLF